MILELQLFLLKTIEKISLMFSSSLDVCDFRFYLSFYSQWSHRTIAFWEKLVTNGEIDLEKI